MLNPEHPLVSGADKLGRCLAIIRVSCEADASAYFDLRPHPFYLVGLAQLFLQNSGKCVAFGFCYTADINAKLIPAHAGDNSVFREDAFQTLGSLYENSVPRVVAVLVIHGFELIKVNLEKSALLTVR